VPYTTLELTAGSLKNLFAIMSIVPLMTIVAHNSDNTISEKAEASFEESDPQRLKIDYSMVRNCSWTHTNRQSGLLHW